MDRKISVLHISDKFGVKGSSVHGVSRLFSWWFPRFDTSTFNVNLAGLRGPYEATENLRKQGVQVINLSKSKFDPLTLASIVQVANENEADILHLHGYGATNFGRIAARIVGAKAIVHEHFVDPSIPAYQIPVDYALSGLTDYGIAVSESVKEFMVSKRSIPEKKVDVVFNGAPLDEFEPADEEVIRAEKERWNIPMDWKVVGTIGRLDDQKGLRYFVDAAARILQEVNKTKFLIVGDGPNMDDLRERSMKHGIGDHVIFTGYQSDIPSVQSTFDVQVFPSLWEGTPLTLFEAMSMERPIVSTPVDGLGEVLEDKRNALLVPKRSVGDLAEAVSNLLVNPERASQLAMQAGRDSHKYEIQHTVDKLQHIYTTLM